jgi:hypothetical protein
LAERGREKVLQDREEMERVRLWLRGRIGIADSDGTIWLAVLVGPALMLSMNTRQHVDNVTKRLRAFSGATLRRLGMSNPCCG